jgi:hypothetical protein
MPAGGIRGEIERFAVGELRPLDDRPVSASNHDPVACQPSHRAAMKGKQGASRRSMGFPNVLADRDR